MRLFIWPGYGLFFLMLFVPTAYQPVKAVLLVLVLTIIIIMGLLCGRFMLHWQPLFWVLALVVVGLAFMLLGSINGAPGAVRVGTVYVVWPLVYTLLVAGTARQTTIDGLFKTLVLAGIAIAVYSLSFIFNAVGWLPDALYFELDQGQGFSLYEGMVEYSLHSISTLLFLVPFLLAALSTWPRGSLMPVSRFWLWSSFLFGVVLVLLSGRRALLLVVAIAPFFILFLQRFLPHQYKPRVAKWRVGLALVILVSVLGVYGYLQSLFGLSIGGLSEMFMTGFDFGGNASASARGEQFVALVREWSEHPFFGLGHGASAGGSVRSEEFPWAYELSYVALLFHTGLVGFAIYTAGVGWIFLMGLRMIRSGGRWAFYMLPALVGMGCFLIGNATNPYLEKFDYIWVIFLPVALINFWLLGKNSSSERLFNGEVMRRGQGKA